MSTELVTLLLFGGLIIFMALGVPVIFSLGAISVLILFILGGFNDFYLVATTIFRQLSDPNLITIPMFVIMGNFLVHSGISDRLFKALNYWFSGIRGSLAVVSICVCVALAMCGGFGPGILTMGVIAVPAMLKQNYDKHLALGSVMAGGVLGSIIPPSIIMIIFAYISRASVGKLFFGGVVPGFITAFLYILYVLMRSYLRPEIAPRIEEHVNWKARFKALKEIVLPAMLVVMVMGSIFLGIATPTEAGSVGALGAFIICIIYRKLSWDVVYKACRETLGITGMAIWILAVATLFGVVYTSAGAQQMVMGIVESVGVNRWFILFAMQMILFVFGMFMDDFAIITICAPIFIPVANLLGFDQIWFSIVFVLNMQVAYLTPPFGWALILMKGVAPPRIGTRDIWRSVPPFVAIQLLVLIFTMIFPPLATWLPNKMF